ncbi:FtsX-like permease family protein [Intestinibacter bartlettii]|uniref:ABC transporter permease n=1 Tax=Intestinibacter bartlettii TaxID=261299 RepID=A0ABS6DUI3_9FIRM|nr:FtsX-like permease family protein [Intestinibacter bartlettii]MBU5335490.1 ABC transporter permease [Intestinibacter bartlettii]
MRKNSAYNKSIKREIASSKARFISIMAIIFLGVAFYTGIKSSGPDLNESINDYFNQQGLMDSKIVSSLGLNENDLKLIENNDKIEDFYATKSVDVNMTNTKNVVKFMEYNRDATVNKLEVVEGRFPKNSGEIALDEQALRDNSNLKIGDTYKIESDEDTENNFKKKSFKIVGFVQSPMYIDYLSRGTTTVGKGSIDYFAVINKADLNLDVYTEIYVRFANTANLDGYSDEYKETMEKNTKYLEDLYSKRQTERIEEVKADAKKTIEAEMQKQMRAMMQSQYGNSQAQQSIMQSQSAGSNNATNSQGLDSMAGNVSGQSAYVQQQLDELDKQLQGSKYYYFDREDNSGYSTYKGSIESLDKIATVFPVIFFLVAALICLTTMTRMVEENRTEIGTLKALGYRDSEIAKKFIVYATTATIAGSVLGIVAGCGVLPPIISQAYGSAFMLPSVKINFFPSYIIQSVLCSLVCTVGASMFVLKQELHEQPSALMRVKAPKIGKKILLERITPIWKRLNFNQKVTFRNLFRYKQRMWMTIIGISGCTAILIAGLGLKYSTDTITDLQFGELMKYDAIVVFNEDSTTEQDKEYEDSLNNLSEYKESINVYQDSVTFNKKTISKQTATMYVPQNPSKLQNYVSLNDRATKQEYKLGDDGAIINEKLAKLLDAKVGDEIVMTDAQNNDHKIKVSHIIENYSGHYVYLSPTYYNKVFGKKATYNAQLLNFKDNIKDEDKVVEKIMQNEKVANVTLASKIKSVAESADMGLVLVVIIAASGSLAFVVLYNLININISERIREISTIKVLGFYDNEVDMYIFRENIILTVLGILIGCVFGKLLYWFVSTTAELDNMMMIPTIQLSTYLSAGIITMIFAVCVMIMMHIRLKNINMIDALKSVE